MADLRGYVTAAGQQFEALAKQMGYPVEIGMIEIGDGVLPDNESPIARTQLVNKTWSFPASVEQDPKNPGQWVAWIHIPPDHAINGQGYFIREIGCKLINHGAGILYAYRRVSNDWKPVDTSGEAKSFIYKLRFIPGNGELLRPTIDPSVVMVDREELEQTMKAHKESRDHPDASETAKGFSRFATQAEVDAAAADAVAVTPKKLNQHYKRKNILGQVSQVAGIPTGAIIERGSNANGEYIKFADGTLVCIASVSITYFQSTMLQKNWVLPHPHVTGIIAIFTGPQLTDVSSRLNRATAPAAAFNGPTTITPLRLFATGSDVFQSGDSANACGALAIGRWY